MNGGGGGSALNNCIENNNTIIIELWMDGPWVLMIIMMVMMIVTWIQIRHKFSSVIANNCNNLLALSWGGGWLDGRMDGKLLWLTEWGVGCSHSLTPPFKPNHYFVHFDGNYEKPLYDWLCPLWGHPWLWKIDRGIDKVLTRFECGGFSRRTSGCRV